MPCFDGDKLVETRHEPLTKDKDEHLRGIYSKEFRHNSDVAEMLCALIKSLDKYTDCGCCAFSIDEAFDALLVEPDLTKIKSWWEEHKKLDEDENDKVD